MNLRPRNWIVILIIIAICAYVVNGIESSLVWSQALSHFGIFDHEGFSMLFVLGIIIVVICTLLRLRNKND